MSLDKATVQTIATLARIDVREEELESLAGELSHILDFVDQLSEVDTDGIVPLASVVAADLPVRADVVTDGNCRDAVLSNAPETEDGFYALPKVVE